MYIDVFALSRVLVEIGCVYGSVCLSAHQLCEWRVHQIVSLILCIVCSHDYGYGESGLAAQIAYSEEHALWKFPSQYYTKTYPIYATNTSMANSSSMGQYIVGYVKTVYIDTTTLAPSENRCCNSER